MANNAVTDNVTKKGTLAQVAAALEVLLETVDTTKTTHLLEIHPVGGNQFVGVYIHAT